MFYSINIWAQSSFSLTGLWNLADKSTTLLNNLENNTSNYYLMRDWGLTFSYGGEFSEPPSSNIYLISLSKRFGNHTLTVRYTPGFQKEFLFSNSSSIILEDSSLQPLNSTFSYKEILGFGYAYKFSPKFSVGFSLRSFTQEFNSEAFKSVSSGDTLFYLDRENFVETADFWKGDIGFDYFLNDMFSFSIASINLLNFGEDNISEENEPYKIKTDRGALFRLAFVPFTKMSLNFIYETSNSFQLGASKLFDFDDSNIGLSVTALHDNYQSPYIAGILGGVAYSNNLWGLTLSGVKYFSDRNTTYSFSEFKAEGIHNIMNNPYSFDKAVLSLSFTLNTIQERLVEFLSVDVVKEIYPTFYEAYVDSPFALGKVVNLTEKSVLIKPSGKIEGINSVYTQSPTVTIQPKDTSIIPFYAVLSDQYNKQRAEISQAYFLISTTRDEPDDNFQSPVLINGVNSWDGLVSNLRYFIKKDFDYSMEFSKDILSKNKNLLDTIRYSLSSFYKAKYVFDDFVKDLVYTSDPRATTEYVQFPNETIELRGGDCDDLSVCYSSLLESIGIETALVDYKNTEDIRHVNILFNTNLAPGDANLITDNDTKYFLRKDENGKDEIWIPVETTSLTNFNTAWEIGAEKFFDDAIKNLGLAKGNVEIIDVY
jgi:transglutaminase-like putative cysteine protease